MTTASVEVVNEIEIFRHHAHMIDQTIRLNLEGLTHDESLVKPQAGGNCLNWVLGHVIGVYNDMLPLVGQERLANDDAFQQYKRGSEPIHNGKEAMPLSELIKAWEAVAKRVDAGLPSVRDLDAPVPFSPTNNPKETVRTLLTTIFFHQAYHSGQIGLLRRVAGKPGAIR